MKVKVTKQSPESCKSRKLSFLWHTGKARGCREAVRKHNLTRTRWCKTTIQKILSQQEYCGDVINFKTCSKSFKNKTRLPNAPENWAIFKDVHEPIIARGDFEKVQIAHSQNKAPRAESRKTARKAYFVICCSAVIVTVSSVIIQIQSIRISITSYVQTTRWITEVNVPADTMSERTPLNRWLCLNCGEWQNSLAADEEAFAELLAQKTDKELLKRKEARRSRNFKKQSCRNDTVSHLY